MDIVNIEIPYDQILVRLGFYKFKTEIIESQKNKIFDSIKKSALKCEIRASFIKLHIEEKNDDLIKFSCNLELKSKDLAKFLKDSTKVFIMGVTAGNKIVEYRDKLMSDEDSFNSIIADAVGSEIVEFGVEWLHDFFRKSLLKEGYQVTKNRYSPGYGDLLLTNQKNICELIQIDKIGVILNENYILIPEKTVTAIVGIF